MNIRIKHARRHLSFGIFFCLFLFLLIFLRRRPVLKSKHLAQTIWYLTTLTPFTITIFSGGRYFLSVNLLRNKREKLRKERKTKIKNFIILFMAVCQIIPHTFQQICNQEFTWMHGSSIEIWRYDRIYLDFDYSCLEKNIRDVERKSWI